MTTSPALRGISLILALLDERIDIGEKSVEISAFKWVQEPSGFYLTGQVVAAYRKVRLTPPVVGSYRQDFACLREAASAKAGEPPQAGFREAQTCICLPAEASAQAGAFLGNLEKMTF
jgi:hypothetical protein